MNILLNLLKTSQRFQPKKLSSCLFTTRLLHNTRHPYFSQFALYSQSPLNSTKMVKIGTHNGTFHCDEALAIYLLRSLEEYKDATLIRTRDSSLLAECDVVVDVGGVYDPKTHRYDHHQREFTDTFSPEYSTKLSSAGLVYKHFGERIISQIMNLEPSDEKVKILYNKVYESFIHALDAIDNGVPRYEGDPTPKYHDGTNLSSRVSHLLPWWNQEGADLDVLFLKAIALTGSEFTERVEYLGGAWLPARSYVIEALENRFQYHSSGRIVVFTNFVPWKEHLFTLEKEMNLKPTELLFVIYSDEIGNSHRVQAIPTTAGSFISRLPLKEEWRGIRDDDLSTLSSIPGCVFVHASGFIGGNKTREGAIAMAAETLASAEPNGASQEAHSPKKPRID